MSKVVIRLPEGASDAQVNLAVKQVRELIAAGVPAADVQRLVDLMSPEPPGPTPMPAWLRYGRGCKTT